MPSKLPPHFIDLVFDTLLKSFWRKESLKKFLRRSHVSENFLAQLDASETKREWLDRLFPKVEASERGQALIQQMARSLADQTAFPDLQNWEDSETKIRDAKVAVEALKRYLEKKDREKQDTEDVARRRRKASEAQLATIRSKTDLKELKDRLDTLCVKLGTQKGGYEFQDWFYDLMDYSEIDNRRPYVSAGRQIDGSITVEGTTYLVELKFTASQSGSPDIDSLLNKVNQKSDNTMGIMVSMSSYSSVAIEQASYPKSPVLLFDHSHLYMVLASVETFANVARRVRRHSSQEGEAFLEVAKFGGH